MFRAMGAFVVAPFPVAVVQSIATGLSPKIGQGVFEHPSSMFVAICLYFYIFGLLIGLPAWLFVRRRSERLRTYAVLGFITGVLPIALGLLIVANKGQGSVYAFAYNLALFGLGGVAAGIVIWLIAVRRGSATRLADTFS